MIFIEEGSLIITGDYGGVLTVSKEQMITLPDTPMCVDVDYHEVGNLRVWLTVKQIEALKLFLNENF